MAEAVITEYAGTRQGAVIRFYQYDRNGVKVLDNNKHLIRLYLFDPSSNIMTERDPAREEKIWRRFIFDRNGMLEETFSFGYRPRTFRYEDGGRQIVVREGGEYGAVGKTFTFEESGVAETAWGRHGEIERVYIFEAGDDLITEREGGWYGRVVRTVQFEGVGASLFREPEAFLQFLIFSERHPGEAEAGPAPAPEHAGRKLTVSPSGSRYAFTGKRSVPSTDRPGNKEDIRIDFIPDGDAAPEKPPREEPVKKSSEISYAERRKGRKP